MSHVELMGKSKGSATPKRSIYKANYRNFDKEKYSERWEDSGPKYGLS